jgi:hypothetical protein
MNEELLNQIPVEDVESLGTPKSTLTTKPYVAIYSCMIISVLLFLTPTWPLGVLMLPLSIFALWKIPNEKRVEFFDDCFVIYLPKRKDICQKVTYEEIVQWKVSQGKTGADEFAIEIADHKYITAPTFNSVKLYKTLNNIIPQKEASYIRKQSVKNTPLKWPWKK